MSIIVLEVFLLVSLLTVWLPVLSGFGGGSKTETFLKRRLIK